MLRLLYGMPMHSGTPQQETQRTASLPSPVLGLRTPSLPVLRGGSWKSKFDRRSTIFCGLTGSITCGRRTKYFVQSVGRRLSTGGGERNKDRRAGVWLGIMKSAQTAASNLELNICRVQD